TRWLWGTVGNSAGPVTPGGAARWLGSPSFQATLSLALQRTGSPASAVAPVRRGPRHCGQSPGEEAWRKRVTTAGRANIAASCRIQHNSGGALPAAPRYNRVSRRRLYMRRTATIVFLLLGALAARADDPGEALRAAARRGDLAAVRAALDAGTSVDAANAQGVTALAYAAEIGRLDIVRLLVERGASLQARDRFFGSSALQVALLYKRYEVARFLLEKGATDADEALDAAVEEGDVELA